MNEPPKLKIRHPSVSVAKDLPTRRNPVPRPSAWVLLPIYLTWIGFIVAATVLPKEVFPFGSVAAVMFFFVWTPFWVYQNWDDVVENRSATYATLIVATVIVGAIQIGAWWDESEIRSELRLSILKTGHSWLLFVFDRMTKFVIYGAILSWSFIRTRISASLISTEANQGADGKAPEADQPPHELTPNTRLP